MTLRQFWDGEFDIPAATVRKIQWRLFLVWVALTFPTMIWWRNSVPWLCFMSVYAAIAAHSAGWQGARAEEAGED